MVADALEWILRYYFNLNDIFHYLDDLFFAAPASSSACLDALLDMLLLCRAVGAPVKPEKVLGPSTTLTILGIELDIELDTNLMQELSQFRLIYASHHRCTKRQLLSLIGKLTFACKVIPAGCIFPRRLLDTAHSVDGFAKQVPITETEDTIKDVEWWLRFSSGWNGVAFFLEPDWTPAHEVQLFTDAAGNLGYGAYIIGMAIG